MADIILTELGETTGAAFLGRGWSFPPLFDPAAGRLLATVAGDEDIQQSLRILFNTEPGERVMNPEYGCGLRQFLFEQLDSSVLTRIRATVEKAVLLYEPRITLLDVHVHADQANDGLLLLEVSYVVRKLNSRYNVVFPFLREATLLTTPPA